MRVGHYPSLWAALVLMLAASGFGQGREDLYRGAGTLSRPGERESLLSVQAIVSDRPVAAGARFHLALALRVAEGAWLYGAAPGGSVVRPQPLEVTIGQTDLLVRRIVFSPTKEHVTRYPDGASDVHNVYQPEGYVFVEMDVPAGARSGGHEVPITLTGQVCMASGVCVPVQQSAAAVVEVGQATAPSPEWTDRLAQALSAAQAAALTRRAPEPAGASLTVAAGLALAVLAGLILNVMPCVLPVIPLRLLSLLEQAGESRRRFVTLGLTFAAGIALFFVAIAGANVALKSLLEYRLKWGDLFRHPEAIVTMVLLLVALAANMFGAFSVTVPGKVAEVQVRPGHLGAVGMGFLMAVLSTPCSFGILAYAFGWAQFQPLWLGTVAILLMGVGMAGPHVVLAFLPGIVSRIPRAGRWSELFKQFVGFVFLLIAVWLIGTQLEEAYPAWVMGYAAVLATCLWAWGSWVRFDAPRIRKWSVRAGAAAVAAVAGWWMLSPPRPPVIAMRPFDPAEIARVRAEGKIALVKFTAGWCAECRFVDMRVYNSAEVADALKARGVVAFKGDVTKRGSPADGMLYDQFGQIGPPVTAVLPPGDRAPILLRGLFSQGDLMKALDSAAAGR